MKSVLRGQRLVESVGEKEVEILRNKTRWGKGGGGRRGVGGLTLACSFARSTLDESNDELDGRRDSAPRAANRKQNFGSSRVSRSTPAPARVRARCPSSDYTINARRRRLSSSTRPPSSTSFSSQRYIS